MIKKGRLKKLIIIIILIFINTGLITADNSPGINWLKKIMDQHHKTYAVYDDYLSAGNNFISQNYYFCNGHADINVWKLISINVNNTSIKYDGLSSIELKINKSNFARYYGGWNFFNGKLVNGKLTPNTEPYDSANNKMGVDLTGATKLTFWARCQDGKTKHAVFYCFGHGSAPELKIEVNLTDKWKKYTINIPTDLDLSNILLGFGVYMDNRDCRGKNKNVYIDKIEYDKSRLDEPRFLTSYKTINSTKSLDTEIRNTSYIYDNCLALLAFLSVGEQERARLVADALLYAQNNDRFYNDGRIRNAYQSGNISTPRGWIENGKRNTVRIPGYMKNGDFIVDEYTVSTDTGNVAWAMLALLSYYQKHGGSKYLSGAIKLGNFIEKKFKDKTGKDGYYGKLRGDKNQRLGTYKSTEHNLGIYAAATRLYEITGHLKWLNMANSAKNFVLTMWESSGSKFYSGTKADGVTPVYFPVVTDCQSWPLLSFKNLDSLYWQGLTHVENYGRWQNYWGFDFDSHYDDDSSDGLWQADGIWYEGTAQMATAYMLINDWTKANKILDLLANHRASSGAMYACGPEGIDSISTGFFPFPEPEPDWKYHRREHVGATAWAVIAEKHKNAFWIGTEDENIVQSP